MRNVLIFVDLFSLLAISFFFLYLVSIEHDDGQLSPTISGTPSAENTFVWMVTAKDSDGNSILDTKVDIGAVLDSSANGASVIDYTENDTLYVIALLSDGAVELTPPRLVVRRVIDRGILGNPITVKVESAWEGDVSLHSMVLGEWNDIEL